MYGGCGGGGGGGGGKGGGVYATLISTLWENGEKQIFMKFIGQVDIILETISPFFLFTAY